MTGGRELRVMNRKLPIVVGLIALGATGGSNEALAQRFTDTVVGSCVYAFGTSHCVRQYRYGDPGNDGIKSLKPPSAEDIAESSERERRWVERCRPALREDTLGVGRYAYAARG